MIAPMVTPLIAPARARRLRHCADLAAAVLLGACIAFGLQAVQAQSGSATPPGTVPSASTPLPAAGGCDKPVYMVVQGRSLDRARMIEYGRKLRDLGLYARFAGGYVASGRPIDIFEGAYPDDQTIIIARFPCHARARQFWYSELYQRQALPLRAGAGQFTIAVYEEQLAR